MGREPNAAFDSGIEGSESGENVSQMLQLIIQASRVANFRQHVDQMNPIVERNSFRSSAPDYIGMNSDLRVIEQLSDDFASAHPHSHVNRATE